MTNEQSVIAAEGRIEELKRLYVSYLTPIAVRISSKGSDPTAEEILKCQQLGADYFNFIENFVGNSGLLGAHANGKWVTGFAETCHGILNAFVIHQDFIKSHSAILNGALQPPEPHAYANMQRMVKEYLPSKKWKELYSLFREHNLPIAGFETPGAADLKKTPKWQLITGLSLGTLFAIAILIIAVAIPTPTKTQFFIFRGVFSLSLSAIAAIIPGLLNIESRYQGFSIRATGAIGIFILVWLLNPPELIT